MYCYNYEFVSGMSETCRLVAREATHAAVAWTSGGAHSSVAQKAAPAAEATLAAATLAAAGEASHAS